MIDPLCLRMDAEFEDVYVVNKDNTPDKNLLCAILERAVQDLFILDSNEAARKYKKQAIKWFLSWGNTAYSPEDTGFTFKRVVQELEISSKTVSKIIELAWSMKLKKGKYYELYPRYRSRYSRRLRRVDK
jgi:hypothetical protein